MVTKNHTLSVIALHLSKLNILIKRQKLAHFIKKSNYMLPVRIHFRVKVKQVDRKRKEKRKIHTMKIVPVRQLHKVLIQIHFFCKEMSSCTRTIFEKSLFASLHFMLLYQRSSIHLCRSVSGLSFLFQLFISLFFCQYQTVFLSVALVMKPDSVNTSTLFFSSDTLLAILGLFLST